MSVPTFDDDLRCEGTEEVYQRNIVEENFDDWKTFDVYTFLLAISYLKRIGASLPVEEIFKEYVEGYTGDWTEETTQKILLYMYENGIFGTYILDNLLSGIYKKIAITKAKHDFDIFKLDFEKDESKKLENGRSVREEALKGLKRFRIW